jgi:hypothetical protein
MHDWTKVPAGIFHDFHNAWITELRNWLNNGVLPVDYYAVGEQRAGDFGPDVLTLRSHLETTDAADEFLAAGNETSSDGHPTLAVLQAPPKVQVVDELASELVFYASKQRSIALRHVSGDELIAIIEIVSPANKHSRRDVEEFINKLVVAARQGIHLLIIDLFPTSATNPYGLHNEFAQAMGNDPRTDLLDDEHKFGLYAYDVGQMKAYLQPLCLPDNLIEMPLFLRTGEYVNVDLQKTYDRAFEFFPVRFKRVLCAS